MSHLHSEEHFATSVDHRAVGSIISDRFGTRQSFKPFAECGGENVSSSPQLTS